MSRNKRTGDKAEKIVIDYFRRKGKKAIKARHGQGYDIRVGKLLIEVKGTEQSARKKTTFALSKKEFECACKNKNFWVYWVNIKKRGIYKKIPRDYILKHSKASLHYRLHLSEFKKE